MSFTMVKHDETDEPINWEVWDMPVFVIETKDWVIRVKDADGTVKHSYHYKTESDAMAGHRRRFINAVMGDQGLKLA